MRENKLRAKIPATAESSRSSGQSIILREGTEGCPRSGTMQLWRRADSTGRMTHNSSVINNNYYPLEHV